jgi:hypothetical protein
MTLDERCEKIEKYLEIELDWHDKDCDEDELRAYIECPGKHLHTTPNGPKDCLIYANPACAIHCVHQSCEEECSVLSAAIKIFVGEDASSRTERRRRKAVSEMFQQANDLVKSIKSILPDIYAGYDYKRQGITMRWTPTEQWERFFSLFDPDDVLWIGEVQDSGLRGVGHFRLVADWRVQRKYQRFTCPAVFDSTGRTVRASGGVARVPYRVIEFDKLHPNEDINKRYSLALMWYLREHAGIPLRAQIDSGHKSIHSWCDNDPAIFNDTFILALQLLGADPNVLKRATQPVRFPGVPHDQLNQQTLIWLSTTKK